MLVMDELIKKLQLALDRKATSVTDLAIHAGVSRQAIYHILNGKYTPNLEIVNKLAASIGYSLEMRKTR